MKTIISGTPSFKKSQPTVSLSSAPIKLKMVYIPEEPWGLLGWTAAIAIGIVLWKLLFYLFS